jgi:hypothetical protein
MILRKSKASWFKPLVTGRQLINSHYLHCSITVNYILPSCLVLPCKLQVWNTILCTSHSFKLVVSVPSSCQVIHHLPSVPLIFHKPYSIWFQIFHNNFEKISCSMWPNQTSIPILSILLQFINSVLHSPVFFSVLMFCFLVFTKNSSHLYSSRFLISPPVQVQLSHQTINDTSNQTGCNSSVIHIQ